MRMSFLTRPVKLISEISRRTSTRLPFQRQSRTKNFIPQYQFQNTYTRRAFSGTIVKMGVHNISTAEEWKACLKEKKIVILDCFATWCGPCKVIAPTVVKFSDEFPSIHFVKIDVDEVPDVAQELGVRAMPTFLIFKDGEKVGEVVGANPQVLRTAVEKIAAG
ncbi:hypothetical protein HYALB_00009306 [Hymenoscyphus albidus]|uniref:Thioredoxin domain-containing protein n=1 Tax=Hymenoscyphus albidus TaxID=595503 RepID=A0A9N9LJG3_9HELO|nr:hypothetical protein HYALB_00009306 [Hymenoscyphus albidus]